MLKKILAAVAALVLALAVVVSMQPSEYTVERSQVLPASPDVVYAVVSDFNRFESWSPWAARDPNMKVTVEGEAGVAGAKYHWAGNDEVGEGEMIITKAEPGKTVQMDLHFMKPFESNSTTAYNLEASGEGTKMVWTMTGQNDFMGKAFGMMMDMDAMIGADFEAGLGKLSGVVSAEVKKIAEAKAKAAAEAAAAAAAPAEGEAPAEAAN